MVNIDYFPLIIKLITINQRYYSYFFSSAGPDLRSVGLWGSEQAMQQSDNLSSHTVGNMATDEWPYRV